MPKKFEYVGWRKYDPLASSEERKYTKGVDYYGGDTQVYLTDLSDPNSKPILISCIHSLTGGRLFRDMLDTSCHGQFHKSYMPGRMDSDPIQITISAMAEDTMKIVFNAFQSTHTLEMMILLPDSRYIEGIVRVESVDFNATNDMVFEYIVTFRRVFNPEIGTGIYTVEYDLKGGSWKEGATVPTLPYYTENETVTVAAGSDVLPPLTTHVFDKFTAYNRVTKEEITIKPTGTFDITANTVIQAVYKRGEGELKVTGGPREIWDTIQLDNMVVDSPVRAPSVRGDFPETSERYPIGAFVPLPQRPNLAIDKHWEIVGWTIDGKPYEFGERYQIMGDTVVEGRWQEMTIMEFSAGTNPTGVVPEPIRVEKDERVTVPALATDPEGHFRAVGWKDETRHVTYTPGQKVALTRDMTLTATWKPLHYAKYSVDLTDVEEGTMPVDESVYEGGDRITMPPLTYITKEGYTFAGWARGSGDTHTYLPGEYYTVKSGDSEEIVFDAVWEEEEEP